MMALVVPSVTIPANAINRHNSHIRFPAWTTVQRHLVGQLPVPNRLLGVYVEHARCLTWADR